MKTRRSDRVLVWALAVSVALHFIVAGVMRTLPSVSAAPERPPTSVHIYKFILPKPQPTATPRPQPHIATRASHPSHAIAHVNVTPPRTHDTASNPGPLEPAVVASGPPSQDVGPESTASPAPSPKPACSVPFAAARTIEAVMPSTPDDAAGIAATAQVQVTLDAAGRVTDARMYRSTNDLRLDRAAIVAARTSTYAPAIVDCAPAGGTYLFRVDFQS